MAPTEPERLHLSGILERLRRLRILEPRRVWLPTWRAMLALTAAVLLVGTLFVLRLYAFLAPTEPVPHAELLIVEGWLPDDTMEVVKDRFDDGDYRLVIASGGPIPRSSPFSTYLDYAQLCADRLARVGIEPAIIVPVAAPPAMRDRTRESARSLRVWLERNGRSHMALDLLSVGPHGRRTWRTFQEELPGYSIGIVSLVPTEYDPEHWWRSSAGVRAVVGELLAYVHFELV
jgi:hypothetical protein